MVMNGDLFAGPYQYNMMKLHFTKIHSCRLHYKLVLKRRKISGHVETQQKNNTNEDQWKSFIKGPLNPKSCCYKSKQQIY